MPNATNHTVPSIALAFGYQFDRGTYRMFEAQADVLAVGIEHVDDVSVHREDGSEIREQDKFTSRVRRALSDKSDALWRTLGTWSQEVTTNPALLHRTEFHLVTNGSLVPHGLAWNINRVVDDDGAKKLATEVRKRARALRPDLLPYGTLVLKLQLPALADLLIRIAILDRTSAQFGGDLDALVALKCFPRHQKELLFDKAGAWLRRTILDAVTNGQPPRATRKAFDREVQAAVRGLKAAPLGSFVVPPPIGPTPREYATRGFIKQLEWIESEQGLIRESLIHYTQAEATRVRWSDTSWVSEADIQTYRDELVTRWHRIRRQTSRQKHDSEVKEGQVRLDAALEEDTVLAGELMPKAITCGNFHVLADFEGVAAPAIGWHPAFESLATGGGKK